MPSNALRAWGVTARRALDQMEAAIAAIGGSSRGRTRTTLTLNHAYCLTLSSQFQAFCRNLHDECGRLILRSAPLQFQKVLELNLTFSRKLDQGNPNSGNIGADFNRFGIELWNELKTWSPRNEDRQQKLDELNAWRKAVAHQSFDPRKFPSRWLRLGKMRTWRRACEGLAIDLDSVMRGCLHRILGSYPW